VRLLHAIAARLAAHTAERASCHRAGVSDIHDPRWLNPVVFQVLDEPEPEPAA
jgi:hypothetical protein